MPTDVLDDLLVDQHTKDLVTQIDAYLADVSHQTIVSQRDMVDMLLDLRTAVQSEN